MKRSTIIQLVAAVTIIVLGVVLITNLNHKEPKSPVVTPPKTAMIIINDDGFSPATIKVKIGTVVIWKNQDGSPHRVAANPYPTHTSLPSLDSNNIVPNGGTYRYTFDKAGTYGYHDELNPQINGNIIVE